MRRRPARRSIVGRATPPRFVPQRAVLQILACVSAVAVLACGDPSPTRPPSSGEQRQEAAQGRPAIGEIRSTVAALAAAGRAGDVGACRRHLTRESLARFAALFANGGPETGPGGWQALCEAHGGLVWPSDATAETVAPDEARLVGSSSAGQTVSIRFLREEGLWRVDYAGHPLAGGLDDLP